MIPPELTVVPRWLRWEYREVNGKRAKVPITVDDKPASTSNPTTWATYDAVYSFGRIGFVFAKEDGLVGVDLDHVLIDGEPLAWARAVVAEASSYTEISPSGDGLHIIGRGAKPAWLPNRVDMPGGSGLEVYDHGRAITITGGTFEGYRSLQEIDIESLFDFLHPLYEDVHPSCLRLRPTSHFDVSVHAVISGLMEDRRVGHPVHGSSTGTNFMVNKGGMTWRCWRHGFTGNALHLLGIERGIISCGGKPSKEQWRDILRIAREEGVIAPDTHRVRCTLKLGGVDNE